MSFTLSTVRFAGERNNKTLIDSILYLYFLAPVLLIDFVDSSEWMHSGLDKPFKQKSSEYEGVGLYLCTLDMSVRDIGVSSLMTVRS